MKLLYYVCMVFTTACALQAGTPIDVVMPCHPKDVTTLELCIDSIKKYVKDVRRIIVVSSKPLTDKAEWFDEARYPFSKQDVADALFGNDAAGKDAYMKSRDNRIGWIYKQLLNLYVFSTIEGLVPNVLVVDTDVIFLKPVSFIDDKGYGLYNPGIEYHRPYFEHMARLLPGLKRVYPQHSGISHHLLFQRHVMHDLQRDIEAYHKMPMWKACCTCIDHKELYESGIAEYEIYFNYAFARDYKVKIRKLQYRDVRFSQAVLAAGRRMGLDYVACHEWLSRV